MSDMQVIKEMTKSLLAMEICLVNFRGYTFIYIVVYIQTTKQVLQCASGCVFIISGCKLHL